MKISVITPVRDPDSTYIQNIKTYFPPLLCGDVELEYLNPELGFPYVESQLHGLFNGALVVSLAVKAAASGADGIFINCFDDPAVDACREVLDIPVFGAYEASVLTALSISDRAGIITTDAAGILSEERKARQLGLLGRIAAIKAVDMDVAHVVENDELSQKLTDACLALWNDNQVGCAVLGCTGMQGAVLELRRELNRLGCPIAVVEPAAAGISWLERLIRLGLTNSLHMGLDMENLKGILNEN